MTPESPLAYWTRRHLTASAGWAERYWADYNAPHRQILSWVLSWVLHERPLRSVLELGCNAGPNLRRLARTRSGIQLHGIDVNAEALTVLTSRAQMEGWGGRLHTEVLPMDQWPERTETLDVIFSCYALTYVEPTTLTAVVRAACQRARYGVLFAEPGQWPDEPDPLGSETTFQPKDGGAPEHRYDYATELSQWAPKGYQLGLVAVKPPADRLNVIVAARWDEPVPSARQEVA